jgi:hypothetical protein
MALHGLSGVSLSGIRRELAARIGAAEGDPVMPFVRDTAQAVFERMKADARGDAGGVERAERRYEEIVEDARALLDRWEGPARDRLRRRLETLLKREL